MYQPYINVYPSFPRNKFFDDDYVFRKSMCFDQFIVRRRFVIKFTYNKQFDPLFFYFFLPQRFDKLIQSFIFSYNAKKQDVFSFFVQIQVVSGFVFPNLLSEVIINGMRKVNCRFVREKFKFFFYSWR